jgi:hypothetical protein
MEGFTRFISATGGRDYVSMPASDYDALMVERNELLAELESCVDYGSMTGDESISDNARAIIAKCRGEV